MSTTLTPGTDRLVHWITPDGIRTVFTLPPALPESDPSETMSTDTTPPLPPEHAARYRMACADLTRAREVDLLTTSRPKLAREFERLRAALDDTLQLVRDIAAPNDTTSSTD